MRNKVGISFAVILLLLMGGCSRVSGKLLIMEGNYYSTRGMYSKAISTYMKAIEYEDAAPYAMYGLGMVYFAIGEDKAALSRLSEAETMLETFPVTSNRELHYRIHYNTGVVLFSGGDYYNAVDSFREALRADHGKIDAKRNLELALQSLGREKPSGAGIDNNASESRDVLFDFIRQNELNRWISREWPEEEVITGPDY
jgi:Ca-activated chloride channel family protein